MHFPNTHLDTSNRTSKVKVTDVYQTLHLICSIYGLLLGPHKSRILLFLKVLLMSSELCYATFSLHYVCLVYCAVYCAMCTVCVKRSHVALSLCFLQIRGKFYSLKSIHNIILGIELRFTLCLINAIVPQTGVTFCYFLMYVRCI